jgi:hypothetical protein
VELEGVLEVKVDIEEAETKREREKEGRKPKISKETEAAGHQRSLSRLLLEGHSPT